MPTRSPNLVARQLLAGARRHGQAAFLRQGQTELSWSRLADRCFRLANAFRRAGLQAGDRVALLFHNCAEFTEANFAAQVQGLVPVPLNYRFTAAEVQRQLTDSRAVALVYHGRFQEAVPESATLRLLVRAGDGAPPPGTESYEALVSSGEPSDPAVPTGLDDLAVIIYTGGTTGWPKGAMLTYGGHLEMYARFLAATVSRAALLEMTDEQVERLHQVVPMPGARRLVPVLRWGPLRKVLSHPRTEATVRQMIRIFLTRPELPRPLSHQPVSLMLPTLPFFHSAGYQLLMLGLFAGKLNLLLADSPSLDPAVVLAAVERDRPTVLANVPAGWQKLLACQEGKQRDLSSVRVLATGSAACPLALKRELFTRFPGALVVDLFGQTEMTPLTAFRIDSDPDQLKERSVGRPLVEVRVVDEAGQPVPAGQAGEIWYRSPTLMRGYFGRSDSKALRADGWFASGDLGCIDEDGELRLLDRKHDCINTGGEKVFPLEVEEVLLQHPAVEEASVFGEPDPEWGQRVCAAIRPRQGASPSPEELTAFCREKLAGYKVPRKVIFVEELPRTLLGKVQRDRLVIQGPEMAEEATTPAPLQKEPT